LIASGEDIRYRGEAGYTALLDAVHGRDLARDPRLLPLLRLLIAHGVDLDAVSTYKESGLRVLSHVGRFDAVAVLLAAGADEGQLGWTPLIKAVALGSLADVERLLDAGAPLEAADWWSRTAWLVALQTGALDKAQLLRDRGANTEARGRCGCPPLHYAIEGHHPDVLRWLLEEGQDVEQADEFGATPLWCAVDRGDLACVEILVAAGASTELRTPCGWLLAQARTKEIAQCLLAAGADPSHLSQEAQRALCGLPPDEQELAGVSVEQFHRARTRRFGAANPEPMREPFWEAMVRAGISGYRAAVALDPGAPHAVSPVWCAHRFGQSITSLADGRVVQIGGEHEDHYDPDFCIYNDVFVHGPDGSLAIYGYPEAVFPPTDFHTATLLGGSIYVIGCLGYQGARRPGHTPVYRLDLATFRMERVDVRGEAPGWIHGHRAQAARISSIRVSGGTVGTGPADREPHVENTRTFLLDLVRREWRREDG
jgi:ankyrin repeat protein